MIGIIGLDQIDLSYDVLYYTEISPEIDSKVLIVSYEVFEKIKDITLYSQYLIVIENQYNANHALKVYKSKIDWYLPKTKNIALIIDQLITNLEIKYKIFNKIIIDQELNQVIINGKEIKISGKEMDVYLYLSINKNKLCSRERILVDVLGYYEGSDSRIVDVYIKYLRTKLGSEGRKIETIRGKGYLYKN